MPKLNYNVGYNIGFSGNYWENNKRNPTNIKSSVAIIGCGYYAYANIAYFLRKENTFFLTEIDDRCFLLPSVQNMAFFRSHSFSRLDIHPISWNQL